jgi:hypothetical protein
MSTAEIIPNRILQLAVIWRRRQTLNSAPAGDDMFDFDGSKCRSWSVAVLTPETWTEARRRPTLTPFQGHGEPRCGSDQYDDGGGNGLANLSWVSVGCGGFNGGERCRLGDV